MASKKNYYEILGVSKTSDIAEIKRAYKKLARQYHPDLNPNNSEAEQKFKEISEAYAVLSDSEKRSKYDSYGSNPFGADFDRAWKSSRTNEGYDFSHMGDFGFDLGDILGDIMMGGAFGSRGQPRKKDLEMELHLNFLESLQGVKKSVSLGSSIVDVSIPQGVETGSKIRLPRKGQNGGDLYLVCQVDSHPFFKRIGDDLELVVPITLKEAMSGGKIPVPTPTGVVDLKIPENISSGLRMKLKGKGVHNATKKKTGDLFVVMQIHMPELSSSHKAQILEILESVKQLDPRSHLQI